MEPLLQLQGICKEYPGPSGIVSVLRGVDVALSAGSFTALLGSSGCGKSTLLSIAGGLLTPDAGTAKVNGEDLFAGNVRDRARRRGRLVGFVFQRFHLLPYLTVEENVMAASLGGGERVTAEAARSRLDRLGMTERLHHRPGQLSAGEQQRVAVARAMAHGAKLLLADEPTGNLDEENAAIILDAFTDFAASGGTVLMVTHERPVAARAGKEYRLKDGALI
ncbi:MAG: ABC transporter ATP-binding protein [Verrucomicrobia bacterium]|nr:ABC transporter ATP-binding protein [Verrucomicrobiota bacterium]MCH8510817.1 ABC transporter ATP-binding protein [Kiritimatiellia bacterium]